MEQCDAATTSPLLSAPAPKTLVPTKTKFIHPIKVFTPSSIAFNGLPTKSN